jgi:hypothetical protein
MTCPYVRRVIAIDFPSQDSGDFNPLIGGHLLILLDVPLVGFLEGSADFTFANHACILARLRHGGKAEILVAAKKPPSI